jgi:hypothetical protein
LHSFLRNNWKKDIKESFKIEKGYRPLGEIALGETLKGK